MATVSASGPFPSLACSIIAALQLHLTRQSAFAQHFHAADGGTSGFRRH